MMRRMGIEEVYRRPSTSKPAPGHKVYPYLLRGMKIERPNHVWRWTSPTSRWRVVLCIWRRWWTGSAGRCWPGGCRSRWRSSIRIRGASSPAWRSWAAAGPVDCGRDAASVSIASPHPSRHKAHFWERYHLADRVGVHRSILITIDVRFHIGRWHRFHLMAERGQPARPGFHTNQTRLNRLKIGQNLIVPQPAPHNNFPSASTPWT